MDLCIQGADLWTPDGGPIREGTALWVEGDRIAAVGPRPTPAGAKRTIAADGLICLPGLVNCHNHVAMTLLRGYGADLDLQRWLQERIWPAEARLTDRDVETGALLGCLEMLRGGTTAFADMYDHMDAVASAVARSGIRASLARGVIGLRPDWERSMAEAEDLCRQAPRLAGGRITAMVAPHAEYTCPPEVWHAAIAVARRHGVRLHTHLSETAAENAGCRARHGCSPAAFLERVGALDVGVLCAHGVHVDAADAARLARPGVAVAHNPVSNAKLGSGIAPVGLLLDSGVRLGLGTDGAASTDTLSLWKEMATAGYLQKAEAQDAAALPCGRLLAMATRDGAAALGLDPLAGTLVPGAPADFILIDPHGLHRLPVTDPVAALVYGTRDADVVLTVVAGRVVMEHGAFPGLDHERVRAQAVEASRRLLGGR